MQTWIWIQSEYIKEIGTGQGANYTIGCILDYPHIKKKTVDCCRCKDKTSTSRWSKSNSTNRFKWKFRSRRK